MNQLVNFELINLKANFDLFDNQSVFMSNKLLFPGQEEVVESGILHSGFNCVLQMPTGSGKTSLIIKYASELLTNRGRLIYLAPTRVLAWNIWMKFKEALPQHQIGIYTGDFTSEKKAFPIPFKDADILIMTPERLEACIRNWRCHWNWIPSVHVLVVDELHLLGDRHRGARLEGSLLRIQRLNPFLRIIGLSATLGNRLELADWLNGIEFSSTWRPIPIEVSKVYFSKATFKPELLLKEVQISLEKGGQILVFVQSRKRAESLSKFLSDQTISSAYHHAGLDYKTRIQVEEMFTKGIISVLIATSTLEMGVNFPVRKVILYDMQIFDDGKFSALPRNSVWQRVGRAGRFGYDKSGEATLLIPRWNRELQSVEKEEYDPIVSSWSDPRHFSEQIIVEIACGFSKTVSQLEAYVKSSLGHKQGRLPNLRRNIQDLLENNLIQECSNDPHQKLKVTKEGYLMVKHQLSPETVFLFVRILKQPIDYTLFDLLFLLGCAYDQEVSIHVDYEELDLLSTELLLIPSTLLRNSPQQSVSIAGCEGKRLLSGLKMALVANAWTSGLELEEIAKKFSCYPFEVIKLVTSLQRLLQALHSFIESKDDVNNALIRLIPLKEKVYVILKMLEAGLSEEQVSLTFIKGVGAKNAKKLIKHGISNIEDLALAELSDLVGIHKVSSKQALRWIDEAHLLVKQKSTNRFVGEPTENLIVSESFSINIDSYRLQRALSLKIVRMGANQYEISGGSEPHLLDRKGNEWVCDCIDFSKGNICKHLFALRLYHKDPLLLKKAGQQRLNTKNMWSIQSLWFEKPI
ncbi:DEAD/DEAH box helicase [Spirosoma spitsbergense]|uniref:DEAD/DEAH box helicase n=1 Tax=Spirosoma spitsbergense TaxID=431554 RepID=UPI00037A5348|nr:DEAD/DEAH box helicase [Spirosoma spitsbergense]